MNNSPVRRGKYNTVDVDEVHSNVGQEVIEITSDKLRLILNDYINVMTARKEWQTPLALFITFFIVICTADFKLTWGLSKDSWSAIFIMLTGMSFVWFLVSLFKMKKSKSVDDILDAAKNKT